MPRTHLTLLSALAATAIAGLLPAACSMGSAPSPSGSSDRSPAAGPTSTTSPSSTTTPPIPFVPEPPSIYVAKVKNVLVGLEPTDAEVSAVVADPAQLKSLIDTWMALPAYQTKMQRFFELAFQQTQISIIDLNDQSSPIQANYNGTTTPLLMQNVQESFARTALELMAEGKPFTETMTTQRFMMTPALMELYGFLDAWQVNDAGATTDRFKAAYPTLTGITVTAAAIPLTDSVNPASPNFMHWTNPDVVNDGKMGAGCAGDPIVYPVSARSLHLLLEGSLDSRKNSAGGACNIYGGTAMGPQLQPADYSTWKMVTIRTPAQGESPTAFFDLPSLRSANELVVAIPRVGFFSTPAFFANWQTNTSNQARVTINQTLIVATGAAVDGTDTTQPAQTPGLDSAHASDAACFGCHQTLDPTRSILAANYSWDYHNQVETKFAQQNGLFAFQGVVKSVASVQDFGSVLAQHPLFAQAWAQKLCYYVNSTGCETDDPEFLRVVTTFQNAQYSWTALVRELLASPLTTYATATKTATDKGEIIAVERRDHLCAALNNRLGLADVCGLVAAADAPGLVPQIVSGLPSDGYGRGSIAPVLPNQPTLLYRSGMENICEAVATLVIDVPASKQLPNSKQWSSSQPDAAEADFVNLVMGLPPSDPRAAPALAVIKAHFASATATKGITPTQALMSTFTLACLAPSAVSIGL